MTVVKIRVKTRDELIKEFGLYQGEPMVEAPPQNLQGQEIEVHGLDAETGDANYEGLILDRYTFEVL